MIRSKAPKLHITLLVCLVLLAACAALSAQTFSQILSFQGRLCDPDKGKPLADGQYEVTFTIYDAASDGNNLWHETQTVEQEGGVFNVHLGTVEPFPADLFAGGDLWLALQIEDDEEMPDLFQLTPSPWAIHAAEADHAENADQATSAQEADAVDGIHASAEPTPNYLLALGGTGTFALDVIPQGPGSGLDADLLDGHHASDFQPIPAGVIVMWSGADIPLGWKLCDGSNGTPDLRDKFVVGASAVVEGVPHTNVTGSLTQTGGEAYHTLTIDEIPPHTHSYRHWNAELVSGSTEHGAKHWHDDNWQTGSAGGGQPHNNLPPYYALCFIMKKEPG